MTTKLKESKTGSPAHKKEGHEQNKKKTSEMEDEEMDLPANAKVKEDSKKNSETEEKKDEMKTIKKRLSHNGTASFD